MREPNRYSRILERIFQTRYKTGAEAVDFERTDIERFAAELHVKLPKNLGDLIYSFRYRSSLPASIRARASKGKVWVIRPTGRSKYRLALIPNRPIVPGVSYATIKVLDSTPGLVLKYAQGDEQALLAKVRYNRLIDIFTGVTCYSLQNHLRTTVPEMGQVETDELYVGVDKRGTHYIIPVQAKGGKDRLNIVQIEQDMAVCADKFPLLVCRPVATQFMSDDVIALFEFTNVDGVIQVSSEKHYRLVPPGDLTEADLRAYRNSLAE